jgi:hypothetical protein
VSVKTFLRRSFARRVLGEDIASRVVVVLPVKESSRDQVRELLAGGPPFDPGTSGLDRHEVYLTDREVIFLFEATDPSALERLVVDTRVWDAAIAWRDCLEGPPRIAKGVYSFARGDTPDGVSFESTPGPGDSEGGDLYPP